MSWTSPHPGPGGPPAAPVPDHGHPPPPPPTAWPAAPAPPRSRRRGRLVLLVALPLALVLGGGAAALATLSGTKTLSDGQDRATITVPRTWTDDSQEDAGREVDQGEESYVIPDVETGGLWAEVVMFVEPRTGAPLSENLVMTADEECEYSGCLSRDQPVAVEVNGRRGLRQVLQHPEGDITAVLTVESESLVVTVLGFTAREDQQRVIDLLSTVVVNR